MITINDIVSFDSDLTVLFGDKKVVFHVWDDLEDVNMEDLKRQLASAFNICPDMKSIERHLGCNGYDVMYVETYS